MRGAVMNTAAFTRKCRTRLRNVCMFAIPNLGHGGIPAMGCDAQIAKSIVFRRQAMTRLVGDCEVVVIGR